MRLKTRAPLRGPAEELVIDYRQVDLTLSNGDASQSLHRHVIVMETSTIL